MIFLWYSGLSLKASGNEISLYFIRLHLHSDKNMDHRPTLLKMMFKIQNHGTICRFCYAYTNSYKYITSFEPYLRVKNLCNVEYT